MCDFRAKTRMCVKRSMNFFCSESIKYWSLWDEALEES